MKILVTLHRPDINATIAYLLVIKMEDYSGRGNDGFLIAKDQFNSLHLQANNVK